ncbi:MAG: hypothetical protein AAFN78_20600, partial [Pseudomonadota bacterium]
MKRRLQIAGTLAGLMLAGLCNGAVNGTVTARVEAFPQEPVSQDGSAGDLQLAMTTTLDAQRSVGENSAVALSVFGKFHPQADRDHTLDFREAWFAHYGDSTEWRVGLVTERWGTLEAFNLVDVINPRDAVEDFQGGVRRGVPAVSATWLGDAATVTAWWLPYSRERRLARGEDRYRTLPLPLAEAQFEDGQRHDSLALRASTILGDTEVAVSHFYGHERMPRFEPVIDERGIPVALTPHY